MIEIYQFYLKRICVGASFKIVSLYTWQKTIISDLLLVLGNLGNLIS